MGLFNFRQKKQLRSIIKEYYGNNLDYFVYNYGNNIYNIPEVRSAIEKMCDVFSVIPIYHKRIDKNGNVIYIDDSISKILNIYANPLQNSTQFIKEMVKNVLLNSNAFIEPIYDSTTGELNQIYNLPCYQYTFELESKDAYVQFYDANQNPQKKYNMRDLIYINRYSQLAGGNKPNVSLYQTVIQALETQIVNVANPKKPRAILQSAIGASGMLKEKDKQGVVKEIAANFDKNINGLAYVDASWKITPINWQENDVNRELMQFVINIVYNYFGISESIINNKATEIEYEMFINNSIKPLALQCEKEFTRKLFTPREVDVGNRIEFDTFVLSISTLQTKQGFFQTALRNGFLNIDEVREQIGYSPLTNGIGSKYRTSADLVNIEVVDQYQLSKNKKVSTSKQDEDIKNDDGKEVNENGTGTN